MNNTDAIVEQIGILSFNVLCGGKEHDHFDNL